MATMEDGARLQRSRLLDHFKRAYQIVVGLAITLACGKAFAHGTFELHDPSLWLFLTFFVTVVPIFHGGDRSLDIKYLESRPTTLGDRAAYIWDVYMLLITAILFVKVAQAIPGPGLAFLDLAGTANTKPDLFYEWMAGLMFFDAVVLTIDGVKSSLIAGRGWAHASAYLIWILANIVFGLACLFIPPLGWSQAWVGVVVFACASVRSLIDYVSSSDFLFP